LSHSVSSNGTKNFDKGCQLVCNRQIYLGHFELEGPNAFDNLHLIYSSPEDPINSIALKDVLHRGLTLQLVKKASHFPNDSRSLIA